MHAAFRSLVGFPLCLVLFSCGGETAGNLPNAAITGAFTVNVDAPSSTDVASASYKRSGGFTSAKPACESTMIGACQIDPCYVSALITDKSALVNGGNVSIGGAQLNSDVLAPQPDGAYVADVVSTQIGWTTGGQNVTIAWDHFPGDATQPGGQASLATPPFIELQNGSPFADVTSTLARDQDLTLAWTTDSAPGKLDHVNIDLKSGSTEIDCAFDASAGNGVVPAAALQKLTAGNATFDIHSKEYVSQKISGTGGSWTLQFNVDAHARTSYGLAKGSITIE